MSGKKPHPVTDDAVVIDTREKTPFHVNGFEKPKRARVRIAGGYVYGDKASPEQVKISVSESGAMLERLGQKITRPGIRIKAARNVPLFSADPTRPDGFVRKLNGKVDRGVLENGTFKIVD